MGRSHVVDLTILRDEVAQYLCSQVRRGNPLHFWDSCGSVEQGDRHGAALKFISRDI
ncbi:MAG: hypothetical protein LH679_18800 [Cyanobacteria bacterium CAN_BIN43]|nr:hypothetical protein [Cyanobacteria bacterium CAN_BIN43]